MPTRRQGRDPRYTRTFDGAPNSGRRYVENGKVRIQWTEEGKRRSRTVGQNSAETRRRADAELEEILGLMPSDPKQAEGATLSIQEALRQLALAILEAADRLIDRLRGAMQGDEDEPADDAAADDAAEDDAAEDDAEQ
jgi:hypothetical protein